MGLLSWWRNRPAPTVCGQNSGAFFGDECEQPYGHTTRHEVEVSVTKNSFGKVVSRTIRHWPNADQPKTEGETNV